MAIIKHLRQKLPRTSQVASIFEQTDRGQHRVYISAITLMEIMYLSEARRIDLSLTDLIEHITQSSNYQIADVNSTIVQSAAEITDVPELQDRIIAGTARWLGVPPDQRCSAQSVALRADHLVGVARFGLTPQDPHWTVSLA